MSDAAEIFTNEILDLLDETFEQHHGIYLDKGASLFQTLNSISAEQASRAASATTATIAAHVKHVSFYLNVLNDYIKGKEAGKVDKVDWKEIWRTTSKVTPDEWEGLKRDVKRSYYLVIDTLEDIEDWGEKGIGGALAILSHSAYHLGAIRHAVAVLK